MKMLLLAKADDKLKDKAGQTAYDMAVGKINPVIMQLLERASTL